MRDSSPRKGLDLKTYSVAILLEIAHDAEAQESVHVGVTDEGGLHV